MNSPADSVVAYILAKDGTRPHLIDATFAPDVVLRMEVRTDTIFFPPGSTGREALTDTLVRRFNQTYENIYTFCIGTPPQPNALSFSCGWLVAMSEKQLGAVRVGCGRYEWSFSPADSKVTSLFIRIDEMEVLSPQSLGSIMGWAGSLPYPWCAARTAAENLPDFGQLGTVARALRADA